MRILVSSQLTWKLGDGSHLSPGKFNCLAGDKCQPIFPRGTIVWSDDKWWPEDQEHKKSGPCEGLKKPSISEVWHKQWDFLHDTHQNSFLFLGNLEKQHQLLWYSILRQTQFGDQKKCLISWSPSHWRTLLQVMHKIYGPLTRWTELHVRDVRCRGNFASDYYLTWSISKSSRLSRLGTWPFRLLLDYLTPQKFTLTKQVSSNGVPPNHPFPYDFPLKPSSYWGYPPF